MRLRASFSGTPSGQAGTAGCFVASIMSEKRGNLRVSGRDKSRDRAGQAAETSSEFVPFAPLEGARDGTAGQTLGRFCPSHLKVLKRRGYSGWPKRAVPAFVPTAAIRSNEQ